MAPEGQASDASVLGHVLKIKARRPLSNDSASVIPRHKIAYVENAVVPVRADSIAAQQGFWKDMVLVAAVSSA